MPPKSATTALRRSSRTRKPTDTLDSDESVEQTKNPAKSTQQRSNARYSTKHSPTDDGESDRDDVNDKNETKQLKPVKSAPTRRKSRISARSASKPNHTPTERQYQDVYLGFLNQPGFFNPNTTDCESNVEPPRSSKHAQDATFTQDDELQDTPSRPRQQKSQPTTPQLSQNQSSHELSPQPPFSPQLNQHHARPFRFSRGCLASCRVLTKITVTSISFLFAFLLFQLMVIVNSYASQGQDGNTGHTPLTIGITLVILNLALISLYFPAHLFLPISSELVQPKAPKDRLVQQGHTTKQKRSRSMSRNPLKDSKTATRNASDGKMDRNDNTASSNTNSPTAIFKDHLRDELTSPLKNPLPLIANTVSAIISPGQSRGPGEASKQRKKTSKQSDIALIDQLVAKSEGVSANRQTRGSSAGTGLKPSEISTSSPMNSNSSPTDSLDQQAKDFLLEQRQQHAQTGNDAKNLDAASLDDLSRDEFSPIKPELHNNVYNDKTRVDSLLDQLFGQSDEDATDHNAAIDNKNNGKAQNELNLVHSTRIINVKKITTVETVISDVSDHEQGEMTKPKPKSRLSRTSQAQSRRFADDESENDRKQSKQQKQDDEESDPMAELYQLFPAFITPTDAVDVAAGLKVNRKNNANAQISNSSASTHSNSTPTLTKQFSTIEHIQHTPKKMQTQTRFNDVDSTISQTSTTQTSANQTAPKSPFGGRKPKFSTIIDQDAFVVTDQSATDHGGFSTDTDQANSLHQPQSQSRQLRRNSRSRRNNYQDQDEIVSVAHRAGKHSQNNKYTASGNVFPNNGHNYAANTTSGNASVSPKVQPNPCTGDYDMDEIAARYGSQSTSPVTSPHNANNNTNHSDTAEPQNLLALYFTSLFCDLSDNDAIEFDGSTDELTYDDERIDRSKSARKPNLSNSRSKQPPTSPRYDPPMTPSHLSTPVRNEEYTTKLTSIVPLFIRFLLFPLKLLVKFYINLRVFVLLPIILFLLSVIVMPITMFIIGLFYNPHQNVDSHADSIDGTQNGAHSSTFTTNSENDDEIGRDSNLNRKSNKKSASKSHRHPRSLSPSPHHRVLLTNNDDQTDFSDYSAKKATKQRQLSKHQQPHAYRKIASTTPFPNASDNDMENDSDFYNDPSDTTENDQIDIEYESLNANSPSNHVKRSRSTSSDTHATHGANSTTFPLSEPQTNTYLTSLKSALFSPKASTLTSVGTCLATTAFFLAFCCISTGLLHHTSLSQLSHAFFTLKPIYYCLHILFSKNMIIPFHYQSTTTNLIEYSETTLLLFFSCNLTVFIILLEMFANWYFYSNFLHKPQPQATNEADQSSQPPNDDQCAQSQRKPSEQSPQTARTPQTAAFFTNLITYPLSSPLAFRTIGYISLLAFLLHFFLIGPFFSANPLQTSPPLSANTSVPIFDHISAQLPLFQRIALTLALHVPQLIVTSAWAFFIFLYFSIFFIIFVSFELGSIFAAIATLPSTILSWCSSTPTSAQHSKNPQNYQNHPTQPPNRPFKLSLKSFFPIPRTLTQFTQFNALFQTVTIGLGLLFATTITLSLLSLILFTPLTTIVAYNQTLQFTLPNQIVSSLLSGTTTPPFSTFLPTNQFTGTPILQREVFLFNTFQLASNGTQLIAAVILFATLALLFLREFPSFLISSTISYTHLATTVVMYTVTLNAASQQPHHHHHHHHPSPTSPNYPLDDMIPKTIPFWLTTTCNWTKAALYNFYLYPLFSISFPVILMIPHLFTVSPLHNAPVEVFTHMPTVTTQNSIFNFSPTPLLANNLFRGHHLIFLIATVIVYTALLVPYLFTTGTTLFKAVFGSTISIDSHSLLKYLRFPTSTCYSTIQSNKVVYTLPHAASKAAKSNQLIHQPSQITATSTYFESIRFTILPSLLHFALVLLQQLSFTWLIYTFSGSLRLTLFFFISQLLFVLYQSSPHWRTIPIG